MYADLDKIKWLLENKFAYNIGKIIGIPNQVIQRLIVEKEILKALSLVQQSN